MPAVFFSLLCPAQLGVSFGAALPGIGVIGVKGDGLGDLVDGLLVFAGVEPFDSS